MPAPVRIATVQSRHVPGFSSLGTNPFAPGFSPLALQQSIDRHLDWIDELVARAAAAHCRLVTFTEDVTRLGQTMTFLDDPEVFATAVRWQTPRLAERLGAAARRYDLFIVASYYAFETGAIYNVADLFAPDGQVAGRYRKVHLPMYERWLVQAGDAFPAFETEFGWVGMLICYDQMWPESAACCALSGAQLICQPSAAELPDYLLLTRARDCQTHFLSSTWRHSMIVSPQPQVLADAGEQDPGLVWADVDLRRATRADEQYWEYLYSGVQDHKERHLRLRQPAAYGNLVARQPPLADQYPEGRLAETPEAIAAVYGVYREMQQRLARGEEVGYHWRW
jgi:predicted amidohydrolase